MMIKKDKQRQSYYNYYSSKKWGRADSYDFCLNSSILGIDGTVKLITQIIEDFEQKEQQVCAFTALTVRELKLEGKNPIGTADLEWIFARNCEGTEQLHFEQKEQ